jgi:tetratricopeptide (TPR) repeat protein
VAEANGRLEEAFGSYQKAFAEREKAAAHVAQTEPRLELVESHLDLAGVLRKRGDSESARTHTQAARELIARTRDKARGHERRLSRLEARLAQEEP